VEIEGFEIEQPLRIRVGREQHLEAPVEQKALDPIRAHPSSESIRGLEQKEGGAASVEMRRAREASDAAADDHDVGLRRRHRRFREP
jgi:hypothetical protein